VKKQDEEHCRWCLAAMIAMTAFGFLFCAWLMIFGGAAGGVG
jgi:hypothetical protein